MKERERRKQTEEVAIEMSRYITVVEANSSCNWLREEMGLKEPLPRGDN